MQYSIVKQFTVNVEDRPGMLAYVCKILADANVSIRNISTSDFRKQGIVRVIPDEDSRCEAALRNAGLIPIPVDVIAVQVKDAPGALARITTSLALCNVNIEYIYGTAKSPHTWRWNPLGIVNGSNYSTMILKVSDLVKTGDVLKNIK